MLLSSKFFDFILVLYSFQEVGLLNPSFNCFVSFTLSSADKATMGIYNYNVVSPAILDITQFLVQLNSRWILQFINEISNSLQKLHIL